jgi:hypothetical protein
MPMPDFALPALNFEQIKAQTEQRLLRLPGYRYTELNLIISPDNYLHILATRENGTREILQPFKLDTDAAALIAEDTGTIFNGNILPMRYILELMGDEIGWSELHSQPFITRRGMDIYFEAEIINSRAYISLIQVLAVAQYDIDTGAVGEYIEFKITR